MKLSKPMYLGIGLGLITLLSAGLFLGGGTEVETIKAQPGNIVRTVEDAGYVQAATDYNYHATQNARVVQVPVETGQTVKPDQVMVVLENLDLSLQLAETRSQLSQASALASGSKAAVEKAALELKEAKDNLARVQELYQSGAITQAEYDRAQLQVETGERNLREQQSRLNSAQSQIAGFNQSLQQLNSKEQQLVLKSPIDGVVLNMPVKPGQVVQPGALLASIAAPNLLEIKADILSDDLAEIKIGQPVSITSPFLGQQVLTGEVTKIYPQAEEKQSALGVIQRRVPVIVSLTNTAQLKPGFEVRVAIQVDSRQNVLVLPRESVRTTKNGQKEVMAVVNNRVQHKPVQIGISDRNSIEIINGLEAGTQVIKDGSLNLAEKTRVKSNKT